MGSVRVLRGDARRLSFADASFDLVLSNSTLEHIPNFWLACEEMKRVLKPGGVMVVSVPGYVQKTMVLSQLQRWSRRMRGLQEFRRTTLTFGVHDHPHDYYRFSEQAVRTVVLDGLNEIRVWPVMTPPRLFGMGFKPSS
jgi:ubiquinone/menaquinone biosynthesis C-methylase UbiE